MMPTIRLALKFGLVADVLLEESDRGVYAPPVIPREEHAASCGCEACVLVRGLKRERGVA